jgi:hypothetical protein
MAAEHTIGEHGRIGDCRIDRRIGSQPGVRHKRMHRQESENITISGARKGRSLRFSPRSALMCYALILSVPAAYAQDGNSRSPLRVPPQIVFCPSARASLFGDFSCPDQQNQRQTAQLMRCTFCIETHDQRPSLGLANREVQKAACDQIQLAVI